MNSAPGHQTSNLPAPVHQLIDSVRHLARISESTNIEAVRKMELLNVHIGTALFWAQQIAECQGVISGILQNGPHWVPRRVVNGTIRIKARHK